MHKEEQFSPHAPRPFHAWLVRHGKPDQYAETESGLSIAGQGHILEVADKMIDTVGNLPHGAVIQPLYSTRRRTYESATTFTQEVRKRLQEEHVSNVTVLDPRASRRILQTADALNPVINNGIDKTDAYSYWITEPEESLQKIGTLTPSQVRKRVERGINGIQKAAKVLGDGPEVYVVGFTHETTLGAILQPFVPVNEYPVIPYGEVVAINIMREGVTYQLPQLHVGKRRSH